MSGAPAPGRPTLNGSLLRLVRMGIDTHQEPVVYMRDDCHVCRSEGLREHSRVQLATPGRTLVATLNVVHGDLLPPGDAGLSEAAWELLAPAPGELAHISHPPALESLGGLRAKMHGRPLSGAQIEAILRDIAAGRYTDAEIAAFLTASEAGGMDFEEVVALTRGMVSVGQRLHWERSVIADKHCVGGLPGNRTTPILVSIVASLGVWIPKTSSRAITSPAGTADTVETLTCVELDLPAIRRVVEREGGCLVWGGAVKLSPVDDVLIRVERALDVDSEAQLVASVLSKKVAAGSTHVLIDMPVGPTAKVRDAARAERLQTLMMRVGHEVGLSLRVVQTDGRAPVGRGIGPALEARDVLAVLRGEPDAPADLRERALRLAGELLEEVGTCAEGEGVATARAVLADGRALAKLQAICEAQGAWREPPWARHRHVVTSPAGGVIAAIDNRRLARTAKLAGAPTSPAAGLLLKRTLGDRVAPGEPLFELHAESRGELAYALGYLESQPAIFRIEPAP